MFGGSGRAQGVTGVSTSLGGLGAGAGAIDPVTLSLHYSEVERPLHPMVKDVKCQVKECRVFWARGLMATWQQ